MFEFFDSGHFLSETASQSQIYVWLPDKHGRVPYVSRDAT